MTTWTRVSRNMAPSRPSPAEEHGAGARVGPAGQPFGGGQEQRRQHEERARDAPYEEARLAGFAVRTRCRRRGQERERNVAGVLAERRGRPANVLEARRLEQAPG